MHGLALWLPPKGSHRLVLLNQLCPLGAHYYFYSVLCVSLRVETRGIFFLCMTLDSPVIRSPTFLFLVFFLVK